MLNAGEQLRKRVNQAAYELLAPGAHVGWKRYLLDRLTAAGAGAAHRQFQVFRTVRAAFPAKPDGQPSSGDLLYRQFIGEPPTHRLQKLFDEFPALDDLCGALVENWIATVAEFLSRLEADRDGFDERFEAANFVGTITNLEAGLSDPHRGGRCVVRMMFENGTTLIYKPRSIAPEDHFSLLIAQLNTSDIPHPLRPARCWDCGDYGWMEDVVPTPCATLADVHAFYWRSGALLGLVYLALGVDIHQENLVAAAEFPVLIDLEALWHPQELLGQSAAPAATSVLRTGFLPQGNSRHGNVYERGAFSTKVRLDGFASGWVHVNQDHMTFEKMVPKRFEARHLPNLNGEFYTVPQFTRDVQAGFRWVGDRLLGDAAGHVGFLSWLHKLIECPRRRILRSTARYYPVLAWLTSPHHLRENQAPTKMLPPLPSEEDLDYEAELHALTHLDVPYFAQAVRPHEESADPARWLPAHGRYLEQLSVIADSCERSGDMH